MSSRLESTPAARPLVPVLLGAAGLIPFVGLAALARLGPGPQAWLGGAPPRAALALYGAVIASFLGGIRWGVAVRDAGGRGATGLDYVLSVVPSLLAWAALALPAPWDLRGLSALVLVWGLVDQDLVRRGLAARWFGRLRVALSLVAGASLLAAA